MLDPSSLGVGFFGRSLFGFFGFLDSDKVLSGFWQFATFTLSILVIVCKSSIKFFLSKHMLDPSSLGVAAILNFFVKACFLSIYKLTLSKWFSSPVSFSWKVMDDTQKAEARFNQKDIIWKRDLDKLQVEVVAQEESYRGAQTSVMSCNCIYFGYILKL